MILNVQYSIEKDAATYVNFVYNFKGFKHGRENIQSNLLAKLEAPLQDILNSATDDKDATLKVSEYLQSKYSQDPAAIDESIKKLSDTWNKTGKNIIYSLEFLFKKPFPFESVTAYLTTNNIFPYNYNERSFYCNYKFLSSQLNTAKHELNHFMFYYYYPHLKEKLDTEKYELLKESITFFSNPEQDGKPNEADLRQLYLSKIWASLDDAIDAGVALLS